MGRRTRTSIARPLSSRFLSGGKTGEEAETHQVGCPPLTDLHIHECTHSLQHISPPLSPFFFSSPLAPLLLLLLRLPLKPFPLNLGVAATPPLTPTAVLYPTLLPYVKTCCWVLLSPPFSCPNIWLFWHLPKTRRAGAGGGRARGAQSTRPLRRRRRRRRRRAIDRRRNHPGAYSPPSENDKDQRH